MTLPYPLIPDICLLVMELIGGKEALQMRLISKSWLEASQYFFITLTFRDDFKSLQVVDHVMMKHVSELIILKCQLDREGFQRFIQIPHLLNLKTIHIERSLIDDLEINDELYEKFNIRGEIPLIGRCKTLSKLEKLTIINQKLRDQEIFQLFGSPELENLKSLHLCMNNFKHLGSINSETARVRNLTDLYLELESTTEDILEMCNNSIFSHLKRLRIVNSITFKVLKSILTNPVWNSLKELQLDLYDLTPEVSNIKCSIQLEKLIIRSAENHFKALISNRSITSSLKHLSVGRVLDIPLSELLNLGSQFEIFDYDNFYFLALNDYI